MVVLWMGGKQIEKVADADLMPRLFSMARCVEMRDEAGKSLGVYLPPAKPTAAAWDADPTPEELEELRSGPSYTYDEVKQMLGWT